MHMKDLYEYAVIRFVPQVEREEFINVGVILYCRKQKFLGMRYEVQADRIQALSRNVDLEQLEAALKAFQDTAHGHSSQTPVAHWEPAERFGWLTAKRSSMLQISSVHPGLCSADVTAAATLDRLFQILVSWDSTGA